MLVSSAGMRAILRLQELGVEVYTGARGTVKTAMNALQNGELQLATAENACKEHGH